MSRYRPTPAIVSDPTMLTAPQGMVNPQDPNDPTDYDDDGSGAMTPVWYQDTAEFIDAVHDHDANRTYGAFRRMHTGAHGGYEDALASEGLMVVGNLNDGAFRKFGTTMISNPAMLNSAMADYDGNLGDPFDVAYGVGDAGDEADGDPDRKSVFYNKQGNLRGRHKTKHLAKKFAKQDALDNRKAIKQLDRGLRKSSRAFDELDKRFAEAETAEPSYADEAPVADAFLAPVINEVSPAAAAGFYGVGALDGEDAFEEAARVLDFVGLEADNGPGDSAVTEVPRGQAKRALRAVVMAAERTSAEPIWVYATSDGRDVVLAVSLEQFPDELLGNWGLVALANGAEEEDAGGPSGPVPSPEVGLFGSKKRKAKRAAKAKMAAEAAQQQQAGELGALYYGSTMITNPAMLNTGTDDFDSDLGSPYSARY